VIAIGERTFDPSAEKKNLAATQLFYRRKKKFLSAKELLTPRLKKKI